VAFQSNQREIESKAVTVNRKNSTSYAFNVDIQLLLGEVIRFYASWTATSHATGTYNIIVSAFSNDPDFDQGFKFCQDTGEVQILEDTPRLNAPVLSPVYQVTGLDPQELYVYPGQSIDLKINVSCPIGLENVTLFYSLDSGNTWNRQAMSKHMGDEWIGTVPGQPEGTMVIVYVAAFSLTGKISRTNEYACRVSDLQLLELRTKIVAGATGAAILVGFVGIFALKRRRMREV